MQQALDHHAAGYNCCQSVVCTYCDLFGIDEKTAFILGEGFGAGMANMENTCGTISGMVLLAGMKNSCGDTATCNTKTSTYTIVRELLQKFKDKNTTVICRELKGLDTGKILRPCRGCIEDSCSIVEEYLLK
ncbi:MAG: C-GCAxxG-C-C family protein [Oscillospiraceae bacterium]